jgi:hypothetical protein
LGLDLVKIPPEIQIRSTIRVGSVYYFPETTFESLQPHYFVVINIDPQSDTVVLLVCSSQIEKARRRRQTCPCETLVEITPAQYPDFRVPSIVDCNYVMEKSINQLIEKLSKQTLQMKTEMDLSLVKQLVEGVIRSPVVERRIKALLQASSSKEKRRE